MNSFTDLVASFHGYILTPEELMSYVTKGTLTLRKESERNDVYRNEKHPFPVKTPSKQALPLRTLRTEKEEDSTLRID